MLQEGCLRGSRPTEAEKKKDWSGMHEHSLGVCPRLLRNDRPVSSSSFPQTSRYHRLGANFESGVKLDTADCLLNHSLNGDEAYMEVFSFVFSLPRLRVSIRKADSAVQQ